jgi:hypothetical protein
MPLPFKCPKVEHVLGIGDIFQELLETGKVRYFKYEPRDDFHSGRSMVYAPDAFLVFDNKPYLLEYQKTPLSSNRWAQKWAVADAFFSGDAYKSASWQNKGAVKFKPRILVISSQEPETVTAGSSLPLLIVKNISSLL